MNSNVQYHNTQDAINRHDASAAQYREAADFVRARGDVEGADLMDEKAAMHEQAADELRFNVQ